MLPKPVVPLCPVTVKDTVVVLVDWFVAIVTLDIWELIMFPLIARSTVAPLAVVAGTVVADGVGVGDGVVGGVVVRVRADVDVVVEVGEGVGAGVRVAVGEGDDVGVGVSWSGSWCKRC